MTATSRDSIVRGGESARERQTSRFPVVMKMKKRGRRRKESMIRRMEERVTQKSGRLHDHLVH